MFHTYVVRVCLKCFSCFSLYIAISVFMLHVASVLSGCCIYFTNILQMYVSNISSTLDLCCIQVFHVASVLCLRSRYVQRVMRARPKRQGKGAASRRLAMGRAARLGSCGQGVLVRILTPRSRPRGERGGGQRKEQRARGVTPSFPKKTKLAICVPKKCTQQNGKYQK
jgi:hypothetical protein